MATNKPTPVLKAYRFRDDEKPEKYHQLLKTSGDIVVSLPTRKLHLLDMDVIGEAMFNASERDRLQKVSKNLGAALTRMLNAYEADKERGAAFGNDQAADEARAALALWNK